MKELTGKYPPEDIGLMEVPRPPEGLVETLAALEGATCLISDVMNAMGIDNTIAGSVLKPVIAGCTIVGPALTILKRPVPQRLNVPFRGDIEAHNLTSPGDILVIEGADDLSNMGGLSALTSKRQGCLGAVIWGGCRDVAALRSIDYPVWSTAVTPRTGVGRIDGVFLNGDIRLGHVLVRCGDIIVADDDGVCVVPHEVAEEVAEKTKERAAADNKRVTAILSGTPIVELAGKK